MTKEMYEDLLERNRLQISELNTLTEEQDKHITDLEKENAELKERLKEHESVGNAQFWANVWSWKTKAIQLANAREIIKKFSEFANNEIEYDPEHPQEHTDLWNKLCAEAEQFLKDSEKEC